MLSEPPAVPAPAAGSPLLSCSCSPKYGALRAWIAAANAAVAPQRQQQHRRTAPSRLQLIIGAAAGLWVQQAGGGGGIGCTKKSLRINFPEESTAPGARRRGRDAGGGEDAAVASHVALPPPTHTCQTLHCTAHFNAHSGVLTQLCIPLHCWAKRYLGPVTVATM